MIGSADGGKTWQGPFGVVQNIPLPPPVYPNTTTFLFDQFVSFAVGPRPVASGAYPLYVAREDYSLGVGTIVLSSSSTGAGHGAPPHQVSDNDTTARPVDEIQPTLAVAANGTVSVAFAHRPLRW